MKVIDFINKLEELRYTSETELSFGFLNEELGEYYECEVKKIDDEDRESGYDDIVVEFKKPKEYIKSEVKCETEILRDELLNVINKYSRE